MEPYLQLEKQYAKFVGSAFGVSCSSGTAALHLSLLALGVGEGDEVIVPDFAMAACAFAVSYCRAKPVFVDVEEQTYGIDPAKIEKAITRRTKAIMVVHTYGRLANIDAIIKIARRHKVAIIEDACEAQGAVKHSKADVTVYSFFKNKIVHAEEGGMITTNSKCIAQRANYLKNMAFSPEHDYFHKEVGYNYRLADAEARLALESLKHYKANSIKRWRVEAWYSKFLKKPMQSRDAVWFYEVFVPPTAKKTILKKITRARDSFKPLSSFPMYGSNKGSRVSNYLAQHLILLPAAPDMTKLAIKEICNIVNKFL